MPPEPSNYPQTGFSALFFFPCQHWGRTENTRGHITSRRWEGPAPMDLSVLPQNHPSLPSAAVQPHRCPQHVPQPPASTAGSPGNPCIPAGLCQSSSSCPAKPPPAPVCALPRGVPRAPLPTGRVLQPLSQARQRAAVRDAFPRQQEAAGTGMRSEEGWGERAGDTRAGHGSGCLGRMSPHLPTCPSTPGPL